MRDIAKQLAKRLPKSRERRAARVEEYTRHLWQGGAWFEELGFYYIGPIDGHDLNQLLPVLKNVRDANQGPILVHVVTKKGKGYAPAEASADKSHGVQKFNVVTGAQFKPKAECAELYARVCRQPRRGRQKDRKSSPSRQPCLMAPVSMYSAKRSPTGRSTSALPSSTQ